MDKTVLIHLLQSLNNIYKEINCAYAIATVNAHSKNL